MQYNVSCTQVNQYILTALIQRRNISSEDKRNRNMRNNFLIWGEVDEKEEGSTNFPNNI